MKNHSRKLCSVFKWLTNERAICSGAVLFWFSNVHQISLGWSASEAYAYSFVLLWFKSLKTKVKLGTSCQSSILCCSPNLKNQYFIGGRLVK